MTRPSSARGPHRLRLGVGYLSDTLQLAPTIVPGEVMYQGTISGIDRIAPGHPLLSLK